MTVSQVKTYCLLLYGRQAAAAQPGTLASLGAASRRPPIGRRLRDSDEMLAGLEIDAGDRV